MSIDALPTQDIAIAEEKRRVVQRSHGVRTLALALGTLLVGTVLYRHGTHASIWVLLVLYGLVWPHIAWLALRRSAHPAAADRGWLLLDAGMGGVWIALMQFNLLPSVLLAVMLAMTLVGIGGGSLLLRGLLLQAMACAATAAANGVAFDPVTRMPELLASIPTLVVFPMTLSVIMHGLAQRVRRQNHVLLEMSSVDSLSGLFNRRYWQEVVNVVLAGRQRETAVMLLIDIDYFKRVNDQHGHTVGDDVIRMVGAIIHACLREGDLAGRYGGDEFVVVLRDADAHAAERVAERIRAQVASSLVGGVPELHCTLSIGIAPGSAKIHDATEWVKAADAALYSAKLAGRNRSIVAS